MPRLFEAFADGHFAACLDNSRGSAQALCVEFHIPHTMAVVLKKVDPLAGVLAVQGARFLRVHRSEAKTLDGEDGRISW